MVAAEKRDWRDSQDKARYVLCRRLLTINPQPYIRGELLTHEKVTMISATATESVCGRIQWLLSEIKMVECKEESRVRQTGANVILPTRVGADAARLQTVDSTAGVVVVFIRHLSTPKGLA